MVDPGVLLAAAEKAPRRFEIVAYLPALQVMRGKGYSWRQLGEWLRGFNIEISPVHLRRLYVGETNRPEEGTPPASKVDRRTDKRRTVGEPESVPTTGPVAPTVDLQQEALQRYEGLS
jgi:hypothetical protein